jgi:hypothetical protein
VRAEQLLGGRLLGLDQVSPGRTSTPATRATWAEASRSAGRPASAVSVRAISPWPAAGRRPRTEAGSGWRSPAPGGAAPARTSPPYAAILGGGEQPSCLRPGLAQLALDHVVAAVAQEREFLEGRAKLAQGRAGALMPSP